jgi:hypothetical protein
MPSVNVPALAIGTDDTWNFVGSGKVAAINADDADTSYIFIASPQNAKQGFTADYGSVIGGGAAGVGVVNSIGVYSKSRFNGGTSAKFRHYVYLSGSYTEGAQQTPTGSYADFNSNALARPGGGSWGSADLTGTEWGFKYDEAPNANNLQTYGYLKLSYEPVSGGFAALVFSVLGPLVAVGLTEIPRLAREIALRTRGCIRLRSDEHAAIFRDLREGRYARHFLMGGI